MRIGLGLAALGRPGYLNLGHAADLGDDRTVDGLRSHAHSVLDAAYAAGIRKFDAARSYGRAEEFLGEWLRANQPHDVTISSKWGYVYTADWQVDADPPEVKHHDVETLRRQLAETRANLGQWLALYQIHSATPDSGVLENEAVLAELAALRSTGVDIGVSVSGTSQGETVKRALQLNLFDEVQATWNLHERAAGPALAAAHRAGLRVYVKEALANGRLAGREPAPILQQAADATHGIFIPAVTLYPGLTFIYTHLAAQAAVAAIIFLLVCSAALASGLLLAGRAMAGTFDALEVITIFLLAIGVLALGFIAWAVATNFHP